MDKATLEIEVNGHGVMCKVWYEWEAAQAASYDSPQDQGYFIISKITHTDSDKNEHDFSDLLVIESVHGSIAEDLESQLILEGGE